MAKFLAGMEGCRSNKEMIEIGERIANAGSTGFLISGGCDEKGRVPLWEVLEGIYRLKRLFPLKVNAHTGLVFTKELATLYAASAIDVFSVDVVGSEETIREVYGLDVGVEAYKQTISRLLEAGGRVVPHITIGINYGKRSGEEEGIDIVAGYNLPKLVLNVLVPLSGTPLEGVRVGKERIEEVFCYARERIKGELVLGCMRPRDVEIEKLAYKYNFAGVAQPTREFVKYLESRDIKADFIPGCCSLF